MVKKIKLTPEEKKKLKHEKILAKKLAAQERKRQIKRDQLIRELQYGRINQKKLMAKWKKMLAGIKLPILKIEFQVAIHNIERLCDSKDFQISYLMDQLDEANEQYNYNLQAHFENIDKVFGLYQIRLNDLKHNYDFELLSLTTCGKSDMNTLQTKHQEAQDYFTMMTNRLKSERKDVDKVLQSKYLSKIDEEKCKNFNELEIKKDNIEKNFVQLWNGYTDVLRDYEETVNENRKEYKKLYDNDTYMRNLIKKQSEHLIHLQDTIKKLKDQQHMEKEDLDKLVECKRNEKKFFNNIFNELRNQFLDDCRRDETRLRYLVFLSNNLIENLEERKIDGEKILKMYELTRKFETQKEKILPFPTPDIINGRHKYAILKDYFNLKFKDVRELESFWLKCGQADTLRYCLYEERKYIVEENKNLKKHLKKYCSGTKYSCDISVMKKNRVLTVSDFNIQ